MNGLSNPVSYLLSFGSKVIRGGVHLWSISFTNFPEFPLLPLCSEGLENVLFLRNELVVEYRPFSVFFVNTL